MVEVGWLLADSVVRCTAVPQCGEFDNQSLLDSWCTAVTAFLYTAVPGNIRQYISCQYTKRVRLELEIQPPSPLPTTHLLRPLRRVPKKALLVY